MDAAYYRRRAEEARAAAELVSDPKQQDNLLDTAATYEQLAIMADDAAQNFPPAPSR